MMKSPILALITALAILLLSTPASATEDYVLVEVCAANNNSCTKDCKRYYTQQNNCFTSSKYTTITDSFLFSCQKVSKCAVGYVFQNVDCKVNQRDATYPCETCSGNSGQPELLCNEQSVTVLNCKGDKCQTCAVDFNAAIGNCSNNAIAGPRVQSFLITNYEPCEVVNALFHPSSTTCNGTGYNWQGVNGGCSFTEYISNDPIHDYEFSFKCMAGGGGGVVDALPLSQMPHNAHESLRRHIGRR